ncbi:MAG: response regulator, partial [Prolixibacteraceae bacterium]
MQADINMNRAFEGNGLGLTIAHKLSKILGSELQVNSEPGKGSVFSFTLPHSGNPETTTTNALKNNETKSSQNLAGKTVLIAEDDEINYLFMEAVLGSAQCKLLHASNGKEAIKIFSENPNVDLIIMDLKMPVMNGIDATMKIKAMDNSVPIVAHSAYVLNNEREQSLAAGCVDYLPKPVKKEELLSTVQKHVLKTQNRI